MLHVRSVSKLFHDRESHKPVWALKDVSLQISRGEFVCLIGPSGSGKTTLLNLMAGFLQPTQGAVYCQGREVRRPGLDRGVVFQDYALFPWLTVMENVAFGLRNQGVARRDVRIKALETLRLVGLDEFAEARPHQLSGGMRQRVALARVWALESPVLLMDEPFGALDVETRSRMQQHLMEVWAGSGKTIVFVTHNVEEAVLLADRIIVLSPRPGRIVAQLPVPTPRPRTRHARGLEACKEEVIRLMGGIPEDDDPSVMHDQLLDDPSVMVGFR